MQGRAQGLDGRLLQGGFQADQVVVLVRQGNKVKPARASGQLDAEAGIGLSGRNGLGDSRVGGLGVGIARQGGCGQTGVGQQIVQQHPRARAHRPVHEACAGARHIVEAVQAQRVAGRDDQALRAPAKADDLVQSRLQQWLVGSRRQRIGVGLGQRVEAGHDAAAFVERSNGVHAAGETDVQMQVVLGGCMCAQGRQGVVMAGVQRQHVRGRVEGHRKGPLQIGAQRLDLRAQAGLRLALGPHELGPEVRQAGRLAFFPKDEFAAQLVFPAFELAPDVAIRQAQRARRRRNGAVRVHGLQQVDQRVAHQRVAGVAPQRVVELDPMHGGTYRRELIGCLRYPIHAVRPAFAPCPPSLKAPRRHWR
ncbi:MAG: hypothetical protein BWX79_02750 [Alphaproteobacteria bacterium ADurb.Bin100]|nr:MAG: hypothetical protein BWX79_02750 [Alphaproteobacteria bacterium ADurb.Bin100]